MKNKKTLLLCSALTALTVGAYAANNLNQSTVGNRKVTVARELTKKFEEFIRSDLETLVNENREFKGELVVVVDKNNNQNTNSLDKLLDDIDALTKKGLSTKDAILAVSVLNKENKNKLYKEYTNKFSN